jgi:hypothetical protein
MAAAKVVEAASAAPMISAAKFFGDLSQTHYKAVGGSREALLKVTTAFYERCVCQLFLATGFTRSHLCASLYPLISCGSVLDDPILAVMFKTKGPEHAYRLMLFLLNFMEVSGARKSRLDPTKTLCSK